MDKKKLNQLKEEVGQDNIEVQSELTKIYQNQDGSLPDISHLEVKRKGRWRLILLSVLGIAGLLASISWLGFLLFGGSDQFNTKSIKLELSVQQNIASGDEIVYILEYKNIEKVALNNVEIIFRYPDGFEFTSAEPAAEENFDNVWSIGRLERNQTGRIEIKGKIIGEVGSLKTINATASFQPENFSSSFKESVEESSQITSSILEINIEGPQKILAEKQATYLVKYRNTSKQDLENIKIIAAYPENFIFKESKPVPYSKEDDARRFNNQWIIENLAKNQEGEIEITGGYLADDDLPEVELTIQIGFFDEETQELALQQEKTIKTQIIGQNLALNLIANGSNNDQPINFGQTLVYSIVYKNLGQEDLENVKIVATLDSDVLDWETIDDKNNGIIEDNTITWSKDQIAELDILRPLDEGSIDFNIRVKNAEDINLSQTNLQVKSKITAGVEKIGELAAEETQVESNEITSNINTDIELKIEGRYFTSDNIPVGTGPLPPVVGQTTSFRIYWSIANSLHEVIDVVVTTALPHGVKWSDKFLVSAGNIHYSSTDNNVTWSIPSIEPNETFDDINVWFDVEVTPTKDQAKKLLILTGQPTLTATDYVTDSKIIKVGKAITSNLDDDPIGGGKGLVVDITE